MLLEIRKKLNSPVILTFEAQRNEPKGNTERQAKI